MVCRNVFLSTADLSQNLQSIRSKPKQSSERAVAHLAKAHKANREDRGHFPPETRRDLRHITSRHYIRQTHLSETQSFGAKSGLYTK